MLQVARPQPATGEKRDEGEDEAVARGDVSETKSKVYCVLDYHVHVCLVCTPVGLK